MQFKDTLRTLILTAFSCLLVFSCITVDKSVGSDYIPDDHKLKMLSASLPLPVTLKMADSIQGVTTSYSTIGAFRTKEFGVAEFGVAGNISPVNTMLDLGKDPKIISTYLNLPLAAVASGASLNTSSVILDPSQKGITQNINVYRLKKQLDSTTLYANSISEDDYHHTLLNTSAATYFGGDSIKIYLDNKFGAELLNATAEELDSLALFSERHPGLYITCDPPAGNIEGGRLSLFDATSSFIYLKCNFQPTWEEGLARKDTLIAITLGYGYTLNTSKYSSKNLETDEPLEELPIEGIGGIAPYVDVADLKDVLNSWAAENGYDPAKVLIAKATLVFPFELPENLDIVPYRYPSYLFPVNRKFANDTTDVKYYYPLEDYNSTDNPMGVMNRSLLQYNCDVSSTIQKIMNKDKSELDDSYSFWFYPLRSETDSYYGYTSYYINNYTYFNAKINGPAHPVRQPELQIVYAVME